MVMITLYVRQQKRHRYKEQTFGFCGMWQKARVGWFERTALKHVYYHMSNRSPVQCFDAWNRALKASALGQPIGMGWGGRLITLQYWGGFCRILTWVSHGCTCVPHPKPPSYLPPLSIPLGCPSALALSALFHALNLHWSSISHMVYTWFNAILSNHCTLAFSHRVQKSVLYICVFSAVSHIGSLLPSF